MKHQPFLDKYERSLGGKYTQRHYVAYARKFLEYAGERDLDKEVVQAYLRQMENQYAAGTRAFAFGVIRRLFKVNGLEWDFRRGDGPIVHEGLVYAPALHPDRIRGMIRKANGLEPEEAAFLALSSVYGLRRQELIQITAADINYGSNTIYIATVKDGFARHHIIPSQIVPYLQKYSFDKKLSGLEANYVFGRIEHKAEYSHIKGCGWHSIRHALVTLLLLAQLPEVIVNDFLRWKRQGASMPQRYYSTTFVGGPEGDEVAMNNELHLVDTKVFEAHPFLEAWG